MFFLALYACASSCCRFYGLSAKLSEPFTNDGKDLVLQLSIKNEQKLDCGGAYIKLTGDIDQESFGGDSPYQVCGGDSLLAAPPYSTRRAVS